MRGKQTCISAIKGVFLHREKESPGRAMNRKKEEEKWRTRYYFLGERFVLPNCSVFLSFHNMIRIF